MSSNILLIHPYVPMQLQYGTRYRWAGAVLPPLGILYIAGVLERAGYQVSVFDANALALEAPAVLEHVRQTNPDVIGLTGTTLAFGEVLRIAQLIKDWNSAVPIVLGGFHAQGTPNTCAAYKEIDYVIPGEGEFTFLKLVRALENNDDINTVPGIYYKKNGQVINTGDGELVSNLDDLPFPARHLLPDLRTYHQKAFGYRVMPNTSIFTQRGCPFKCVFCSSSLQFRETFNMRVRAHSVDYVRAEIQELVDRWGIREIYFADDTFNLKKKRVYEMCDMFRTHFPKMLWSCNFEVNIADEDLLRTMKKAGCWLIQIGAETGDAEIMERIQKGITLEQLQRVTKMASDLGMAVKASFILGNPGDTRETIEKTIRFAESLPIHYITFGMMAPLPGSYFWDMAETYGTFDKGSFDKFSMVSANYVPHGLTADYLREKQREAHQRVYLRFTMAKRHLHLIRSLSDFKRYTLGAISLVS